MVTTRPATAADEVRVMELLPKLLEGDRSDPAWWPPVFRELLDSDRGAIIIAEDETGVLGLISLSFNLAMRYGGDYAQIEELIVDEAARGKHVGAALVQASIECARQQGCREIGLYAREHNRPFYEKYGFRYTGPELRLRLDR